MSFLCVSFVFGYELTLGTMTWVRTDRGYELTVGTRSLGYELILGMS